MPAFTDMTAQTDLYRLVREEQKRLNELVRRHIETQPGGFFTIDPGVPGSDKMVVAVQGGRQAGKSAHWEAFRHSLDQEYPDPVFHTPPLTRAQIDQFCKDNGLVVLTEAQHSKLTRQARGNAPPPIPSRALRF